MFDVVYIAMRRAAMIRILSVIEVWALLALCLGGSSCAQYAEPVETGPATAEDYNTMHDYLKPEAQVIETLPWSEVTTNDFEHHGEGYLVDHLRNHPMLGDNLERLHEFLHQKIERLRPRAANGGAESTVFFEGTDAEFNAWKDRQSIESAGWKIVRLPPGKRLVNVVAIGKTHFSHAGHLTVDALRRFVTQFENRQFKPVKNAKARFVSKLKVFTRSNCSWCDKWLATEYAQALADGVAVEFVTDETGTVPRFEICNENGQCRQYTGFTLWSTMKGNG